MRTMFHALPLSLNTIKKENPDLDFDVYAAIWDSGDGRVKKINDPHHYVADVNVLDSMVNSEYITEWLNPLGGKSNVVQMLDSSQMNRHLQDGRRIIGDVDHHLMPQYYSTLECFRMVEVSKYTHIVRLRPDIVINNFPSIETVNFDLVTNINMWYSHPASIGFENEMIWVVKPEFAMESASLYTKLHAGTHSRGPTFGEAMTGRHFKDINCVKARYNFDYRVAR
jgi:hypothetical protein